MRIRVHHPLFAGFLGVVGLLVVFMVVLGGAGLGRELRGLYRAELARELRLAAAVLPSFAALPPDSIAGLLAGRLGYRVALIDTEGVVVGDSEELASQLREVENQADRPEVAGARGTGLAFAERESPTGVALLYGATRVMVQGRPLTLRLAAPLATVDATVRRSQAAAAAAGALAMILAVAVAYLLSRVFTRPLVELAERAGAFAAGDFSRRVPSNTRVAELAELAVGFNRLADQLQTRLGELGRERDDMQALIDSMAEGVLALTPDARVLRINRAARHFLQVPEPVLYAPVGTIVRQPELRELLEQSVARPAQAREVTIGERRFIVSSRALERGGSVTTFLDVSEIHRLEQVRRDFVANVSHELKTPLTSIRGFAETLVDDDPPEQLRRQFLRAIRGNTLRLQRLVDDLLDLSRLESGSWMGERQPVAVAAAAREAWEPFEGRAREKRVTLEVQGDAVAEADEQGLSQIFQNLFDNALRYSPDGGSIRVRVDADGRMVTVAVSDTGTGIPARALPRIFERFYRVDPARAREKGGTGLGLAIVRHLVQGMGGEASAESELGRGTTIRFTLPLERLGQGAES